MHRCRPDLEKCNVAIVSEEYPPHIHGGVGTFCYSLATSLSKRKISTTVFAGRSSRVVDKHINDYLEIVRLPFFNFPPRHVWFQLQNFSNISKKFSEHDFSLVHSASPEVSPICVYLKKKFRKPLVTSYHGYSSYEMKAFLDSPFSQASVQDLGFNIFEYPIYDAYNRISIAHSNRIVSCSYAVLNELRTVYRHLDLKKSCVINNGIDLNEFDDTRTNMVSQEKNREHTIVFFGRWYWSKGIQYLLEAVKMLRKEYPTLELRLCGKGPMEPKIRAFITKERLENNVRILGHVPRSVLLTEIMQADAVVLPSLREAQPISVLEAMACKRPVVVFDFPFVSEYIQDSVNGLLAKPKDSKDLAAKIGGLILDTRLQEKLGENAYKYVQQEHNWDIIAERYIELYNNILNN